jgi:hypothetical protein
MSSKGFKTQTYLHKTLATDRRMYEMGNETAIIHSIFILTMYTEKITTKCENHPKFDSIHPKKHSK